MINLGELKANIYTFQDGDSTVYCNPLRQEAILLLQNKDLSSEEKAEMLFKSMMPADVYDKYKDEPLVIKEALATDYLQFHLARLEKEYPHPGNEA